MGNFFKPAKDGSVLHLTKSGRWEKCTIPVGCTRHVDLTKINPDSVKDVELFSKALDNEWSEEAYMSRNTVISPDDYNGWEPEEDDPFDDMKMNVTANSISSEDAALSRKTFKAVNGVSAYIDKIGFSSSHDECKSYQTACKECAQKHEVKLSELFSLEELSLIVREDSVLYPAERKQFMLTTDVNGEEVRFMSHAVAYVLDEFPESEKWNYVPNKTEHQLVLEREGINFSDHTNDDGECRICGQYVYDMYCMECWTPAGYLNEE